MSGDVGNPIQDLMKLVYNATAEVREGGIAEIEVDAHIQIDDEMSVHYSVTIRREAQVQIRSTHPGS